MIYLCTQDKWEKCNAKQYKGYNKNDYPQNCKKTNSSSAKIVNNSKAD